MHTLTIGDLDLFCDLACAGPEGDTWRTRLTRQLEAGRVRAEWCFTLAGDAGRLAAVAYWAPHGGAEPVLAWLFDHGRDAAHGAEVLRRSVGRLGVSRIMRDIRLPAGQRPETAHPDQHAALLGGGFTLEVERVEVRWRSSAGLPSDPGRLRYRAARDLSPDDVLDAVRRVAVGSLDHDTRTEAAAGRAEQDALAAYESLTNAPGQPHWFQLGYLGDELVGLVVPAAGPDWAAIDYIGVVPEHRGHGYVDDLLARGTATLAEAGAQEVTAGTDTGNHPMVAAFIRAGYADEGRIFRYYWRAAG